MSETVQALLLTVFFLAGATWVGGYVAVAVVSRTAAAALDPGARVAFFRSLGRAYLRLEVPALAIALLTGAVLARNQAWGALLVSVVVVAALLVACLAVAVGQARRMTVLRRGLVATPDDHDLRHRVAEGSRNAGILRAVLGVLTLALVVLGAFLAA